MGIVKIDKSEISVVKDIESVIFLFVSCVMMLVVILSG